MAAQKPVDVCEIKAIDEKKVRSVKKTMLTAHESNTLSETFSVLADPTRLKLIYALSKEELCVCDIAGILEISVSAVSHQLRILRNMRLVKFRKHAKMVFYSLDDKHIANLFLEGLKHVRE